MDCGNRLWIQCYGAIAMQSYCIGTRKGLCIGRGDSARDAKDCPSNNPNAAHRPAPSHMVRLIGASLTVSTGKVTFDDGRSRAAREDF
jgi:hypothetical protein